MKVTNHYLDYDVEILGVHYCGCEFHDRVHRHRQHKLNVVHGLESGSLTFEETSLGEKRGGGGMGRWKGWRRSGMGNDKYDCLVCYSFRHT